MQGIIISVLISICAIICLSTIISYLKNILKQLTIMNRLTKMNYIIVPNYSELTSLEKKIYTCLRDSMEDSYSVKALDTRLDYGINMPLSERIGSIETTCNKMVEKGIITKIGNEYCVKFKEQ